MREVTEAAWALLPKPEVPVAQSYDFALWNYFVISDRFIETRRSRIRTVLQAVERLLQGEEPRGKVISTRYTNGLPALPQATLAMLGAHLRQFLPEYGNTGQPGKRVGPVVPGTSARPDPSI
jgi:hypothetical protein